MWVEKSLFPSSHSPLEVCLPPQLGRVRKGIQTFMCGLGLVSIFHSLSHSHASHLHWLWVSLSPPSSTEFVIHPKEDSEKYVNISSYLDNIKCSHSLPPQLLSKSTCCLLHAAYWCWLSPYSLVQKNTLLKHSNSKYMTRNALKVVSLFSSHLVSS